ncbi:competence protein ComK [Ectobacillus funiculus]
MAIVPVLTVDNRILSGILEEEDTLIALPRPYEVVDQSCRFHGSSFEGRKEGTRELIGITHKAPIAISSTESLYFLSTLSYTRRECSWISHFHVTNTKATPHNNVLITFMNGQSFEVGISKTSFDTLLYRTAHLRSESEDRQSASFCKYHEQ